MKTTTALEMEDIDGLANAVVNKLKPLLLKNANKKDDGMMDLKGLCEYLKVTKKWVYERTHLREIPFTKLSNKQLRFKKQRIDEWTDRKSTPAINEYTGKRGL